MFAIMLLTIMIPYHGVLVPQSSWFQQFGWVNTFLHYRAQDHGH